MPEIWLKMRKSLVHLAVNSFFGWLLVPENQISCTGSITTYKYNNKIQLHQTYPMTLFFRSDSTEVHIDPAKQPLRKCPVLIAKSFFLLLQGGAGKRSGVSANFAWRPFLEECQINEKVLAHRPIRMVRTIYEYIARSRVLQSAGDTTSYTITRIKSEKNLLPFPDHALVIIGRDL